MSSKRFWFVVEHLDQELGPWSKLEYRAIEDETKADGANFMLSSVPHELLISGMLHDFVKSVCNEPVERHMADRLDRICLLDPAATQELSPRDADCFDIFLYGGILGALLWHRSCYQADVGQETILLEIVPASLGREAL